LRTSPLFGKRVLVTRARDASLEFAEQLREAGAEPIVAPTIAIGAPDDDAPARAALRDLAAYRWIAFSSQNGVDACFAMLAPERDEEARRFGSTRVAAIGAITAQRLRSFGVEADFVPASFVAEEIAAGLLAHTKPGDRVLVFGAQTTRDVLAEELRNAGRLVDVVAAYKTRPVTDPAIARAARDSDIWTFTSASTVNAFVANVADARDLARTRTIACIGPVTAEAARRAGLSPNVVAEEFTARGLIDALERAPSR
jgi:uroporphyrinogen III methyltransferase/synthase